MKKRFFYEFSGNVFLEANDQDEAEKLVKGISLDNYLINEKLHEIDEHYISFDLHKRKEQLGTDLHPFENQDEYQEFKMRENRYGNIFNEFFNGKFDKKELMKRMDDADKENSDDYTPVDEISMVNLKGDTFKTVKQCFVD